jgi:hypothetical protein
MVTVPAIETLEKLARAMEIPMYQIFYDGEAPAERQKLKEDSGFGSSGADARTLGRFLRLLCWEDGSERSGNGRSFRMSPAPFLATPNQLH